MKKFLIAFTLGVVLGAGGFWYLEQDQAKRALRDAEHSVAGSAEKATGTIHDKLNEIKGEDIQRELERFGVVIQEKAREAGTAIWDATANTRTSAAIKAKLLTEPGISSMNINVDTTDGVVTLAGAVASPDQVAKAVKVAMETEGVTKVISTLQVKSSKL